VAIIGNENLGKARQSPQTHTSSSSSSSISSLRETIPVNMPRPSPEMEQLLEKKRAIEKSLENLEKQIYALETSYLEDTNHVGNLVKGWDGYLSRGRTASVQKKRVKDSDRLFSLSSITSGVQSRPDE
jgi:hypothetical protein